VQAIGRSGGWIKPTAKTVSCLFITVNEALLNCRNQLKTMSGAYIITVGDGARLKHHRRMIVRADGRYVCTHVTASYYALQFSDNAIKLS
jgi:hypothetical protein